MQPETALLLNRVADSCLWSVAVVGLQNMNIIIIRGLPLPCRPRPARAGVGLSAQTRSPALSFPHARNRCNP